MMTRAGHSVTAACSCSSGIWYLKGLFADDLTRGSLMNSDTTNLVPLANAVSATDINSELRQRKKTRSARLGAYRVVKLPAATQVPSDAQGASPVVIRTGASTLEAAA